MPGKSLSLTGLSGLMKSDWFKNPGSISALRVWLEARSISSLVTDGAVSFSQEVPQCLTLTTPSFSSSSSFTVALWVYLQSKANDQFFISRGDEYNWEYYVKYDVTSDRFQFGLSRDGTGNFTTVSSDKSPSLNTWYFLLCSLDLPGKLLSMQVDNSQISTAVLAGNVQTGATAFYLGAHASLPGYGLKMTGTTGFVKLTQGGFLLIG